MTQLGFLETSTHEQVFYYLIRAANASDNEVTVFTTAPIATEVQDMLGPPDDDIEWVTIPENGSIRRLLRIVERHSAGLDALIVQPLYHNVRDLFYYARFSPECPTALWLFNINAWLRSRPQLDIGLRRNLRLVLRRYIANRNDAYLVEYPSIAAYVREEMEVNAVESFVPTLYEPSGDEEPMAPETDQVRITIPGNVSPNRRDYALALDAFERAATPDGSLELRLQGQRVPASDPIYERCKRLRGEGYAVTWSTEWVPLTEFHDIIAKSDAVLAPLRTSCEVEGITELYGRSKGSGNISDALRNGVPILLPESFPVDEVMGDGVRYFDGVERLTDHLRRLRDDPDERVEFKSHARAAAREYTLGHQQERFASVLSELLPQ